MSFSTGNITSNKNNRALQRSNRTRFDDNKRIIDRRSSVKKRELADRFLEKKAPSERSRIDLEIRQRRREELARAWQKTLLIVAFILCVLYFVIHIHS